MSERGVSFPRFREGCRVHFNGWSVPLLTAWHETGGQTLLLIDRRMGYGFDAANIDSAVSFAADLIATCWGYGAHPRDDAFDRSAFARVPHSSLAPARYHEISQARMVEEEAG